MKNKIICGNNIAIMKTFPDNIIDLTVTSPPYDNLRTYNGYSFDFEGIAKELYRITKDGGVVVWVVGDATVKGSETGTSFKQALYFKEVGFNLHDTMIYAKENWVPLTHNRYEQQFEYMFVFSKGKPKTWSPIKINCIHAGRKNPNGTFRHTGKNTEPSHTPKNVSNTKTSGNIWSYQVGNNKSTTDKIAYQHPATFPEQLANDHIISWSNPGDLIFDPFIGSGTTAKMALLNGRDYLGIDISEEYCNIAKQRIEAVSTCLTH